MNKNQAETFMKEMEKICQQASDKIRLIKARLGDVTQVSSDLVLRAKKLDDDTQNFLLVFEAGKKKTGLSSVVEAVGAAIVRPDITTGELAKRARLVNEALREHMKELEEISQNADLDETRKRDLAEESAILLDLIQIRIGTLNKISKIVHAKYNTNLPGRKHITKDLDILGRALFDDKNQHENSLLSKFSDFFGKKIDDMGMFFQSVFKKSPAKTPKSVNEFLKINKEGLFKEYSEAEMYDNKSDLWRQMAYKQHQKNNPVRVNQLNLLAKVMEGVKNDPENIKFLKLKGCLLALKHQLKEEWKAFDSRLESLVDAYLKIPELQRVSAEEALENFKDYANIHKKQLSIDGNMMKKIEKSAADTPWLQKLDNLEKRSPKQSL